MEEGGWRWRRTGGLGVLLQHTVQQPEWQGQGDAGGSVAGT